MARIQTTPSPLPARCGILGKLHDGWASISIRFRMPKMILVAFDGSTQSEQALRTGIEWGALCGGEVHVIFVEELKGSILGMVKSSREEKVWDRLSTTFQKERRKIERRVAEIAVEDSLTIHTHTAMGDPREEILRYARFLNADLIVVGSRGRGTVERLLLGSVSSYVAGNSTVPTLIVP